MKHQVCGIVITGDEFFLRATPRYGGLRHPGMFNGFGGTVATGEGFRSAMARLFAAQTQGRVPMGPTAWSCFHQERFLESDTTVHYMAASCDTYEAEELRTLARLGFDAGVHWIRAHRLPDPIKSDAYVENLCYILPMAYLHVSRQGHGNPLPF